MTNTKDISIRKENGIWHITDYGRGLNYHHLTQNENDEKLSAEGLIGKFGVGLKDSLAVFYRNGVHVTIRSCYGVITLKQMKKAGFDDVMTLHAEIADPDDLNMVGTDVSLDGCTDTDIFGIGQFLFIQGICNDFTDGMVNFPVFQYFFYVEIEFFSHIGAPFR